MNYQITQTWQSLNTLTSEPAGTEFTIQNQGRPGDVLLVAVSETQPIPNFYGAEVTHQSGYKSFVSESPSQVWVRYYRQDIEQYPQRTMRVDVSTSNDQANETRSIFGGLLTSLTYLARRIKVSINPELIDGNKAITVQPFTELNIKNGSQFYARVSWPLGDEINVTTPRRLYFETGDQAVLIKDRFLKYVAEEVMLEIFANPTGVTGGTDIMVSNWNAVNPNATTIVAAKKDVSVTTEGTPIQNAEYLFGSNATAQRDENGIPEGYERVIPANTGFIVKFTNTGTGNARLQYGLSWYEGVLSVDVDPDGLG